MKQLSFVLSVVLLTLFILATAYVFRARTTVPAKNDVSKDLKIRVVSTFYPLGEFARQVGGKLADVSVVVPTGVEPHEYEPTPRDIASIYTADIFIVNGAGLDAWATKIRPDLESKGVKVIVMSQVLGFDDGSDAVVREKGKVIDPHFWLDPILVEKEVASIADILTSVDMKNQAVYTENAKAYIRVLQSLDQSYRDGLATCKNKTIVTSHNALNYLSQQYQFETLSIAGFSPEGEPSARQLADLAMLARQKKIRYIFFETLASPRLSQTLADEIGAETLIFNPLEGLTDDETAQGKDYVSVMRENLHNLQLAMECYE